MLVNKVTLSTMLNYTITFFEQFVHNLTFKTLFVNTVTLSTMLYYTVTFLEQFVYKATF